MVLSDLHIDQKVYVDGVEYKIVSLDKRNDIVVTCDGRNKERSFRLSEISIEAPKISRPYTFYMYTYLFGRTREISNWTTYKQAEFEMDTKNKRGPVKILKIETQEFSIDE